MASASSTFTGTEASLSEGGVWVATSTYWNSPRKANGLGSAVLNNDCARRYTGVTWSNDHYSEMTLASMPAGAQLYFHYCFVRMNATAGCYMGATSADVALNILQIWRISDAGAYTQIGTNITTPSNLIAGDVVRLEVVGTQLTMKLNGSILRQSTDSTFSTGVPGVGGWASSTGSSDVLFTSSWAAADITADAAAPPMSRGGRNPSYQFSL